MDIEFDPTKDEANIARHGISLARAVDFVLLAYVADARYEEPRFRLYGTIEGLNYCIAGTLRGTSVRVISLRRAHAKEMRRHVK